MTDARVTEIDHTLWLTADQVRPEEEWRDHITSELTAAHWNACGLSCPVLTYGGTCRRDRNEECDGSSKFDSAAAETLWEWSLDSSQDETSGEAQYGNGWHALFKDERAILQTVNSGAVYAWTVDASEDLDAAWAAIEAGAVYEDDDSDDDE